MSNKGSKHGRCAEQDSPGEQHQLVLGIVGKAPGFDFMPTTPDFYETYLYTAACKIPYKICPKTDCEEVTTARDPDTNIVEKFNLHNEPVWSDRVKVRQVHWQVHMDLDSRCTKMVHFGLKVSVSQRHFELRSYYDKDCNPDGLLDNMFCEIGHEISLEIVPRPENRRKKLPKI